MSSNLIARSNILLWRNAKTHRLVQPATMNKSCGLKSHQKNHFYYECLMMIISSAELAARWAYAELRSTRFAKSYKLDDYHPLRLKALYNIPFTHLLPVERRALQMLLSTHEDRGPSFYPTIMKFQQWQLHHWPYEAIAATRVAPGLGWHRFSDFEKEPTSELSATLETIARGTMISEEPAIVVPCQRQQDEHNFWLLMEGTLRSLCYARDRTPFELKTVWAPVDKTQFLRVTSAPPM